MSKILSIIPSVLNLYVLRSGDRMKTIEAIKLLIQNIHQIFDYLKYKKQRKSNDLFSLLDTISKYLITTEVRENEE